MKAGSAGYDYSSDMINVLLFFMEFKYDTAEHA